MFHVEMRAGIQVVREFNLSTERLWVGFLAPLVGNQDFSVEGHEFTPRSTRVKVYEGPSLRPDQLSLGRGWQNVERTASDVTERVLEQAREHAAERARESKVGSADASGLRPHEALPAAAELVRERLLGRIAAGPLPAAEIMAIATELMPQAGDRERVEAAQRAAWVLLERGVAQLTPSGR